MLKADSSPTFCVMPWMNLATETNGKCKICCVVMTNRYIQKDDGSDFLIQRDGIREIFDSAYVRRVRKMMMNGEWPSDCFYCKDQESKGGTSPRIEFSNRWMNEDLKDLVARSALADGSTSSLPRSFEPRPGIKCNLKCNTCWSMSSSSVRAEREAALRGEFGLVPEFLRNEWENELKEAASANFDWSEEPAYLDNFRACIPTLERVYFTGGEPTLIDSNRKLLKELIAHGKTDLLVSFTSNLTVLDEELLNLGRKFSRFEITGSIDGFGAVNDYIRYPSQWRRIERNLHLLRESKLTFTIMSVIQGSNIFGYVDLLKWLAHDSPFAEIRVLPTVLQFPVYLRLELLTPEQKRAARAKIDDALSDAKISEENRARLARVGEQLAIENPDAEILRGKFAEYIRFLDRARGTRFETVFPHLKSLVETE